MSDPLDVIEDRQANPPKLWTPRGVPKGSDAEECITDPKVAGVVEEIDVRVGDYGTYPVIVLVGRDRDRIQVAGFGTVLGRRLRQVRAGDAVGIEYRGERPSSTPGMAPYADYQVVIVRDGAIVSAGAATGDAGDGDYVAPPGSEEWPDHETGDAPPG